MPRCEVPQILQVELAERRNVLGPLLYDAMLTDLTDNSAATAWAAGSYTTGSTVIYEGSYYTALQDTNQEPPTAGHWRSSSKFDTGAYGTLWCDFLGPYLALKVCLLLIPKSVTKLNGAGAVRYSGESLRPAKDSEIDDLHSYVEGMAALTYANMNEYLLASTDVVFANYLGKLNLIDACVNNAEPYLPGRNVYNFV